MTLTASPLSLSDVAEDPPLHILFHRSTPWQSPITCSTKTFANLARKAGYEVSYMQGSTHPGHLLRTSESFLSWKQGPRLDDDVALFTPFSLVPLCRLPGLRGPRAARLQYRWTIPGLRQLLQQVGRNAPDVVWTTRLGSSEIKKAFPSAKVLFHAIDYYPAFNGRLKVKEIERQDYADVDGVLTIGQSLTDYLTRELHVPQHKILTLGQGVHLDKYSPELSCPPEIASLPKPRAIWVGWMAKLDRSLLRKAAQQLRERGGSVALVGPSEGWVDEFCRSHPNVSFVGPVSPQRVPAYLKNSDIGLMLYERSRSEIYYGQNPLKLYEYAAAGLSIVSTPHHEFNYINPPVQLVQQEDDLRAAVSRAIEDREALRRAATAFAETRSWQSLFERVCDHFNFRISKPSSTAAQTVPRAQAAVDTAVPTTKPDREAAW